MFEILKLRTILKDIYKYQVDSRDDINNLNEENIIQYLQSKYKVNSYNKVKTKIDELMKLGFIKRTSESNFETTGQGYRIKRSIFSALLLGLYK